MTSKLGCRTRNPSGFFLGRANIASAPAVPRAYLDERLVEAVVATSKLLEGLAEVRQQRRARGAGLFLVYGCVRACVWFGPGLAAHHKIPPGCVLHHHVLFGSIRGGGRSVYSSDLPRCRIRKAMHGSPTSPACSRTRSGARARCGSPSVGKGVGNRCRPTI